MAEEALTARRAFDDVQRWTLEVVVRWMDRFEQSEPDPVARWAALREQLAMAPRALTDG